MLRCGPPAGTILDVWGMAVGNGTARLRQHHDDRRADRSHAPGQGGRARNAGADDPCGAGPSSSLELSTGTTRTSSETCTAYATLYFVLTGTHFRARRRGPSLSWLRWAIFLRAPAFTREHHAGVRSRRVLLAFRLLRLAGAVCDDLPDQMRVAFFLALTILSARCGNRRRYGGLARRPWLARSRSHSWGWPARRPRRRLDSTHPTSSASPREPRGPSGPVTLPDDGITRTDLRQVVARG